MKHKTDPRSLASRITNAKQFDAGAPILFSVQEAAARLRIGISKMWEMKQTGEIPHVMVGRAVRIPATAIYDYLGIEEPSQQPSVNGERLIARLDSLFDRMDLILDAFATIGVAAAKAAKKR